MPQTSPDLCPLCLKPFAAMSSHLKRTHEVHHREERRLLLNLACGRVNVRSYACPIQGCDYNQGRLDKHLLRNHPELTQRERAIQLHQVKRNSTLQMIRALRDNDASLPVVSDLLLEPDPSALVEQPPDASWFNGFVEDDVERTRYAEPLPNPVPASWAEPADSTTPPDSPQPANCQPLPDSVVSFLESFKKFFVGGCPDQKRRENATSKANRVRAFLEYMASGCQQVGTWLFLDNVDKIRMWPAELDVKSVTTKNIYLKNVHQFMQFFTETPPPSCRLAKRQQTGVSRALKSCIRDLSREVVLHQIQVKDQKVSRAITGETLTTCRELARSKIPELLGMLENEDIQPLRYRFYGYMTAFIASIYGHRTGVFANMTVAEVQAAKESAPDSSHGFVINVREHKTNRAFGMAQIYLTRAEFLWIERWLRMRPGLEPTDDRVFTTGSPDNGKVLLRYLQVAWEEMELTGTPTFTDIRTAVATHARNYHSPEVRHKLSHFMCHDTSTADRFYALHLTRDQSKAMRDLFEQATTTPTQQTAET